VTPTLLDPLERATPISGQPMSLNYSHIYNWDQDLSTGDNRKCSIKVEIIHVQTIILIVISHY
jgi:hypothetical protein